MKILFVCTGNICRSPTAEAVARHQAKLLSAKNSQLKNFIFDSAGIEGYHVGDAPDSRSLEVAKAHGVSFDGIFARQISSSDFEKFDLLMAMDHGHKAKLDRLSPAWHRHKIHLFLQFCDVKNSWNDDVIDPYYRDLKAFEEVFNVVDVAVGKMLTKVSNS